MKRFLAVCLCLAFVVTLFIPASAAETSGVSFNILDFVTLADRNVNHFPMTGSFTATYDISSLLGGMRCYYYEIIYTWSNSEPSLDSINANGAVVTPTTDKFANGIFRSYGNFNGLIRDKFELNFSNSSGTSYVTILSFEIYTVPKNTFYLPGTLTAVPGDQVNISPGGSATATASGTSPSVSYRLVIPDGFWQTNDFVDVGGMVGGAGIVSVAAYTSADQYIPISYNYLNNSNTGSWFHQYFSLRMDLTQLDKTQSTGNIQILFTVLNESDTVSTMTITGIAGVVPSSPFNVQTKWYQILWRTIKNGFASVGNWLTSGFDSVVQAIKETMGFSASEEDKQAAQTEQDKVNGVISDIQDNMPTVPDIDNQLSDAESFVPGELSLEPVSVIFYSLYEFPFVSLYVSILSVMVLASYVLFGKWW